MVVCMCSWYIHNCCHGCMPLLCIQCMYCVSCHCLAGVLLVSKEIAVKMFRRQPQMLIVQMRNKQLLEVKTWHCIGQISVFDCCSIVYSDDELCTKTAPYTLFATIALYVLPHHTHVPTASYLHLPLKPPPTPHTSTHPLIPPPAPSHLHPPPHTSTQPLTLHIPLTCPLCSMHDCSSTAHAVRWRPIKLYVHTSVKSAHLGCDYNTYRYSFCTNSVRCD